MERTAEAEGAGRTPVAARTLVERHREKRRPAAKLQRVEARAARICVTEDHRRGYDARILLCTNRRRSWLLLDVIVDDRAGRDEENDQSRVALASSVGSVLLELLRSLVCGIDGALIGVEFGVVSIGLGCLFHGHLLRECSEEGGLCL